MYYNLNTLVLHHGSKSNWNLGDIHHHILEMLPLTYKVLHCKFVLKGLKYRPLSTRNCATA